MGESRSLHLPPIEAEGQRVRRRSNSRSNNNVMGTTVNRPTSQRPLHPCTRGAARQISNARRATLESARKATGEASRKGRPERRPLNPPPPPLTTGNMLWVVYGRPFGRPHGRALRAGLTGGPFGRPTLGGYGRPFGRPHGQAYSGGPHGSKAPQKHPCCLASETSGRPHE